MTIFAQFQKTMRELRKVAIQRGVIAVLDVGTSQITCMVLKFDEARVAMDYDEVGSLAGHSGFRIIGSAVTKSRGLRLGEIDTMIEAESAIRTVVSRAQKAANVRVDHVIACLSGATPQSYNLTGSTDVAHETVSYSDVGQSLAACDMPNLDPNRMVLHAQPVNFSLDQRSGLKDPIGHVGRELSADLHMLTVDDAAFMNLANCLKRCDLELSGLAVSPYVSGLATLTEDEQELGAACVDLGAGSSSISIFAKRHMIYTDSVRMGGSHITSDISQVLEIPIAVAEKIKTLNGAAIATSLDDHEMINIGDGSGDWERDRRQISRSELIGIIRPRVDEILEAVHEKLEIAGFEHAAKRQIVLTGGASQLPGLDGLAAKILNQNVRMGRPMRVNGLKSDSTSPAFSAAVGLALFAASPQDEWWDFETSHKGLKSKPFQGILQWIKNNW